MAAIVILVSIGMALVHHRNQPNKGKLVLYIIKSGARRPAAVGVT